MSRWEKNAKYAQETFGTFVDWEERFYNCPCCGEPIYESDWNEEELAEFLCPVCEDADDNDDFSSLFEGDECGFDPYLGCYTDDC